MQVDTARTAVLGDGEGRPAVSSGPKIGFTGHQGLTPATERLVLSAFDEALAGLGDFSGICSLAEGSDQLFAKATLDHDGDLTVVVPCENYEATFDSVDVLQRYTRLKAVARSVVQLDHDSPTEEAFWAAGQRVVNDADRIIAVWDGKPSRGLGGAADVVLYAQSLGKPVQVIWPEGAERS